MRSLKIGCLVLFLTASFQLTANSDWKDDIDYTKLVNERATVEDGSGIIVSMTEVDIDGNPNIFTYMPNLNNPEFAGKNIVDGSGLSSGNHSSHSTGTARFFFGASSSIAPGSTDMTVYEANDYLNRVLGFAGNMDPLAQPFSVQNHSWIGFGLPNNIAEDLLQRVDYIVDRDQISIAVGINNGSGNSQPQLLGQAYNVISVGRTDGNHSRGFTTLYGPGRIMPDVVNSANTTSRATAQTSSVLTVLHHKAQVEGNADARRPETMKAILMAGATKDEFPGWSRTTTQPLDAVFGAGEVNIYNSYHIIEGGETDGGNSFANAPVIDRYGYDYGESISPGTPMYYNFQINPGQELIEASAILNWNIDITDTDPSGNFSASVSLADMSLRLYDSTNAPLGTLLDASLSPVDNVEHIYVQNLGPGLYTLEITTDLLTDYGFAWRATVIPEPSSLMVILAAMIGMLILSHRRRRPVLVPVKKQTRVCNR